MRILRIFKLVRHFAGLQSLFYTLQQAYQVSFSLIELFQISYILTYLIPGFICFNIFNNWEQSEVKLFSKKSDGPGVGFALTLGAGGHPHLLLPCLLC